MCLLRLSSPQQYTGTANRCSAVKLSSGIARGAGLGAHAGQEQAQDISRVSENPAACIWLLAVKPGRNSCSV